MSLYLPRSFDVRDLACLDALAAAHPFATLVTVHDGLPFASHVPVLYARGGDAIDVRGHLARPNPQAFRDGPALLMLHGPDAYVSPTWYPDKAEQARVPTWNYVVAHLAGELEWFDDEAPLAALVGALADVHERSTGSDWRFDVALPAEREQLRGIVGFRLHAPRITLKAKLSQNHPHANRHSVIARLEASARAGDRDVAAWMRRSLDPEPAGA